MSMEKELLNTFDKELLLKDLCARLPYGVKVNGVFLNYNKDNGKILYEKCDKEFNYEHLNRYETLKPYLFPLSSMTDAEKEEYCQLQQRVIYNSKRLVNEDVTKYINWCYKKHLDINNLIPIGLAIDATGLNIY